ncbi:MAG: transposase [Nitrososphaerota archaeon]|jgi:transposase|nr:transposase [Nitrososphaerota archaeon]
MELTRIWFYFKLTILNWHTAVFLVFLPAYSPDFNRIENRWANMKGALVDLAPKCETLQETVYTY